MAWDGKRTARGEERAVVCRECGRGGGTLAAMAAVAAGGRTKVYLHALCFRRATARARRAAR